MPQRTLSEQEFNAIRDQVIQHAPPGLKEDEFQRFVGPAMEQALGIAENTAAPLQGSSMARALSGLWKQLNPVTMAEGVWSALPVPQAIGGSGVVEGPTNFMRQAAAGAVDQFQKAQTAPTLSEKLGHYAAAVIPVIGPPIAGIAERGVETGDVAGMIGQGAGMIAPFAAVPAIKTGVRAAGAVARNIPGAAAVADMADAASTSRLAREMAPQVGPNKTRLGNQAAAVAPDLAREPGLGAVSRGSLAEKVTSKLDEAASQLDEAADARLASQQVQMKPLLAQIDKEIAAKVAEPVEASKATPGTSNPNTAGSSAPYPGRPVAEPFGTTVEPAPNTAQISTLRQIRKELAALGDVAPYESVRRIRQAWDQVAKVRYMPATAQDALKAMGDEVGASKGTAAMREALAATDPASAATYQRFSLFKKAQDVVKAAEEADRVRPNRGRGIMARTAGAMIGASQGGPVGAGIGAAVASIVDRAAEFAPSMQILIARRLAAVADALRKGDAAGAQAILERVQRQVRPVRTGAKVASQARGDVFATISAGDNPETPAEPSAQR